MAAAARGGGAAEAAELRLQLEAHARLSEQWGAKAAKLLERVLSLQQRSSGPGSCLTKQSIGLQLYQGSGLLKLGLLWEGSWIGYIPLNALGKETDSLSTSLHRWRIYLGLVSRLYTS